MASFNQIPFKTSRGVAAYVKANAPAGLDAKEVFPHKSSGYRAFPNVTCLVSHFSMDQDNPGSWHVNVILSIRTECLTSPESDPPTPSNGEYASEALVGSVLDLFELAVGTDNSKLADLITAAGRAWAVDASGGTDPLQAQFAANNADLALFKVDSIHPLPGGTSGVESDSFKRGKGFCWVDDFPFALVVRAVSATEPE